jgi:hypothetical protein
MHNGDLLAAVAYRVFERELDDLRFADYFIRLLLELKLRDAPLRSRIWIPLI